MSSHSKTLALVSPPWKYYPDNHPGPCLDHQPSYNNSQSDLLLTPTETRADEEFSILINRHIFKAEVDEQDEIDARLFNEMENPSSLNPVGISVLPQQRQSNNWRRLPPRHLHNLKPSRECKNKKIKLSKSNWPILLLPNLALASGNVNCRNNEDPSESEHLKLIDCFQLNSCKPMPTATSSSSSSKNAGGFYGAKLSKPVKQVQFKFQEHATKHKLSHLPAPSQRTQETFEVAICTADTPMNSNNTYDEDCNPLTNNKTALTEANDFDTGHTQVFRAAIYVKYDFNVFNVKNQNLAATQERDKIIEAIENNQVTIIDGFTGCGKTTQVPQFIIDYNAKLKRPCNVIVTQPRKLAAVSVARRVSEERGWPVGTVVGYQVGMDKSLSADTLITFMTTGVLLQKLIHLKSFKSWTHIIVDEVHERDLHTDLLLLFIKKILLDDVDGKEKTVKLILMSATLDSKKFSEYFAEKNTHGTLVAAPIISIPTLKRHYIEELFLDNIISDPSAFENVSTRFDKARATLVSDICKHAVDTIVGFDSIEKYLDSKDSKVKGERGSVLVFLPGLQEIKYMQKLLQQENQLFADSNGGDPDHYKWDIIPLHSSITNEEQSKVFALPQAFRRKIILSTNIAESSITVPDIIYVIDFCLTKSNCVDPRTNFNCLRICWASVNQCIQRKGRTGRVRDGKVYRMVPKKFFKNELRQETEPDMLKSALEYVVLQVKTLNMGSPQELLCLALDAPPDAGIKRAVTTLKEVGGMTAMTTRKNPFTGWTEEIYDVYDGDVTFLGEVMSSLPISPQCSRLIMLGHCFGVLKECIIIAAGLSSKSPFATPFNKQLESYLHKLKWSKKSNSDCFALLYAYQTWEGLHKDMEDSLGPNIALRTEEKQWGRQFFVQVNQMREIRTLVKDIENRLTQKGLVVSDFQVQTNPGSFNNELPNEIALMIKLAIAGAFYPNYFHRHRPDKQNYERERLKQVGGHDLFSTVYFTNFPSGHNGELYAKRIATALSYELSFPNIIFHGQKVFCIFDGSGIPIGPISESVHRAIKKRQIREQLEFKLLWEEEEFQEVQRQTEQRYHSDYRRCPPQTVLPGVNVSTISVVVSHAESPSKFWIISNNKLQIQKELARVINSNLSNVPVNRRRLQLEALVLAPFEKQYFRARVQAINEEVGFEECLVYFIDYGNSDWVSINNLQDLTSVMISTKVNERYFLGNLPGMAVECRLSETKPAVIHGSVWPEAAVKAFKTFTRHNQEFEIKIFAIDKSIIIGELLDIPAENKHEVARCNFNNWLISNGFADIAHEPYTADLNYKARMLYASGVMTNDNAQIAACNQYQIAEPLNSNFLQPPNYGTTTCCLKGPYSPLELEFQSICLSSKSKQINVDNFSVNSVILDQEPTAPTSRLLVASSVNIQGRSGRVVARGTTVMPAVPGMLALVSLIFTPKAELRTDLDMQKYTGALCGLGADRDQQEHDHDMEIIFDTEMDDNDIEIINYIRHDMNLILRGNRDADNSSVQTHLRKTILELLKRKRSGIVEEIWPPDSYVWDCIPHACIKSPPLNNFPSEPLDIFKPHSTVQLSKEGPWSSCAIDPWEFVL